MRVPTSTATASASAATSSSFELATVIVDETVTAAPASTCPDHRRAVIPRRPAAGTE
jgi:hypothetical protein